MLGSLCAAATTTIIVLRCVAARGAAGRHPSLVATPDDKTFLFNLLLHCADISNPAKPAAVYAKWCELSHPAASVDPTC